MTTEYLKTENDFLKLQLEFEDKRNRENDHFAMNLQLEIENLKKQNEILEEALKKIMNSPENTIDSYSAFKLSMKIAKEALKQIEEL
jgi:hypothetical protein